MTACDAGGPTVWYGPRRERHGVPSKCARARARSVFDAEIREIGRRRLEATYGRREADPTPDPPRA